MSKGESLLTNIRKTCIILKSENPFSLVSLGFKYLNVNWLSSFHHYSGSTKSRPRRGSIYRVIERLTG